MRHEAAVAVLGELALVLAGWRLISLRAALQELGIRNA
jgi:hypothetical protein